MGADVIYLWVLREPADQLARPPSITLERLWQLSFRFPLEKGKHNPISKKEK